MGYETSVSPKQYHPLCRGSLADLKLHVIDTGDSFVAMLVETIPCALVVSRVERSLFENRAHQPSTNVIYPDRAGTGGLLGQGGIKDSQVYVEAGEKGIRV